MEQCKQRIDSIEAVFIKANKNITTKQQANVKVMQILRTRVCAQELYIDHTKTIAEGKAFIVNLPPGHRHKPVDHLGGDGGPQEESKSLTNHLFKALGTEAGRKAVQGMTIQRVMPRYASRQYNAMQSLQRTLGNNRTGLTLFSGQKPPLTTKKTLSNCR